MDRPSGAFHAVDMGVGESTVVSRTFFFFLFIKAAPASHGNSPARGGIRVAAAGLHHSHSNAGSKPHL